MAHAAVATRCPWPTAPKYTFTLDRLLAIANTLCAALLGPSASRDMAHGSVYASVLRELEAAGHVVRCGGGGGEGGGGGGGAGGGGGGGDRAARRAAMAAPLLYSSAVSASTAFALARTLNPKAPLDLAQYLFDYTLG